MGTNEFNLSEKMNYGNEDVDDMFYFEDVKEFIRLLKESGETMTTNKNLILLTISDIDKLAGDKLI
jgi:hypothetical protein